MSTLHGVCVLIIISIGYASAKPTCGPNELMDDCPRNCSYEFCPQNEHQDSEDCPKPATCPAPACKCGFNYRRDENGTCIPTEECQPFECTRPNEVFDPCPSYCPGEACANANPTGECLFLSLLVVNCSPSCRCKPQHWRSNGTCVPYLDCPEVQEALQENGNKEFSIVNFYLK